MNEKRALDHKSIQLRVLVDSERGASSEVFLLVFTSDGVLVTEDEVKLRGVVSECGDMCKVRLQPTLAPGQVRSGPNMTTQGVLSENSLGLVWKPSSRSLM